MTTLIDAALGHSRTVLSTLLLILVAGSVAYVDIPKEADPDINIPIIYVHLSHDGIAPEDAERLLLRPMETELRAIEGVTELRASAYEGGANLTLEFDAGFDADVALADVREKVDRAKPDLPDDTDEPTVSEINLSLLPIIVVTLSGPLPERTLYRIARDLRDDLESLTTVLEAEVAGDREELIEIIIDPLVVESYGLDATRILADMGRNNQLIAAGQLDTGQGRFSIKVPGLFESRSDLLSMPVKVNGDRVVTVGDIATVRRTFKDADGFARIDGETAVAIEVSKRTGENIIETIEAVKARVAAARADWPATLRVAYSQDKSTDIRTMLVDLQNNVISAILLVMIVVVATLGLRAAGLVGMAVPGSFLTGILVLAALGFTVNIVVLFSLILSVGMLVDGAIVVTEFADREMAEGADRRTAYARAAKRMFWPITASTATTLAAFMPLVFWPGVVGEFMKYLPITLLATLAASLLMALVFLPTLGALIGKPNRIATVAIGDGPLKAVTGFTGRYLAVLRAAIRRPILVLATAAVLLVGVNITYVIFGKGIEFFPDVEPENAVLQIHARGNLSIGERDGFVREVEAIVLAMAAARGEFDSIYARTVSGGSGGGDADTAEDVIGVIQLEFADWQQRRPAAAILAEIRQRSAALAGIYVEPKQEEAGPPVGKPVQVQLASRHPALLDPAIDRVRAAVAALDGVTDVEDSRPIPGIDWELTVDRTEAAKFGADVALVGNYVKLVTTGLKVTDTRQNDSDNEIDIVARYPEAYRTLAQLDQIRVRTDRGLVPVSTFVTRAPRPKTGALDRVAGQRVMSVKADVREGVLPADKVTEIQAWLATAGLDPRIAVTFKGEDEEQQQASQFLARAFAVALFVMALILVTQFNSFYSAFLILSAVIMSTLGVLIGLLVTGQAFGIVMSGIGVIALAGIVVNNNIVLIDTYDHIRKTAATPEEAILRTGAQRLRPVLLTTVTTVLGLMPMVLGMTIDFITREVTFGTPSTQWWSQLSTGIVFGLSFATLLTLIVTPAALMLQVRWQRWRAA